jgi:hypothetical protein
MILLVIVFIIITRVLFLSIVFPCCWSCSGQLTTDNSEGIYSDGCRRKHIIWSLVRDMEQTTKIRSCLLDHIHPCTEEKEDEEE